MNSRIPSNSRTSSWEVNKKQRSQQHTDANSIIEANISRNVRNVGSAHSRRDLNSSREGNTSRKDSNSRDSSRCRKSTTESDTTAGRIHQLQAQQ
jgi:hypothetical protein